jgi:hypothetical protein
MSNLFQKMAEENSKYPKRMGQHWDDSETAQLLKEIREKTVISEIARKHERTEGGITSRLKALAWEYHSEGRGLEEIMKFTGLSESEIQKTILRRSNPSVKAEKNEKKNDNDILEILKDIQSMMKELVENTRSQKKFIIKKKSESLLTDG